LPDEDLDIEEGPSEEPTEPAFGQRREDFLRERARKSALQRATGPAKQMAQKGGQAAKAGLKKAGQLAAQAAKVDALCVFAYPPQCFLTVGTAIAMGINFNAILLGPGGCFAAFPGAFGPAVEGVMFEGAWCTKSSPAAKAFYDKFSARYPPAIADWWGHILYQGAIEFFEQAIVKAGTLDHSVIRKVMATSKFDTVLGPTWFDQFGEGGCLLAIECHAGEIGQWINGIPEVIDPPNKYGEKRTAPPEYPKPAWPKK